MKILALWVIAALAPVLFLAPLSAKDLSQPAAEKTVEAKTPSLTFYYFDG